MALGSGLACWVFWALVGNTQVEKQTKWKLGGGLCHRTTMGSPNMGYRGLGLRV